MLVRNIYSFRIAYQSEEQVRALEETPDFDPQQLVLETLPDGQLSFKTIHVPAFSPEDAMRKAELYTSRTPYKDIPNNTTIT